MSRRTLRVLAVGMSLLLLGCPAALAQTTRPAAHEPHDSGRPARSEAPEAWPMVVGRFAAAATAGEVTTAYSLLAPRPVIRCFDHGTACDASVDHLVQVTSRATVLGVHAYPSVPATLAADVAADVKASSVVPEKNQQEMSPTSGEALERANTTAAQWVAMTLDADKGNSVGVIVLWDNLEKQVNFILLRGELLSTQEHRVKHLVFGNPLAAGS